PADGAASLRPGEMLFNFQEADIQAVVKTVSQITGRNFLMDPRVKGKITIISTRPVSKNAVYQIFLAALKAQGFTAVTGPADILKIVPLNEAKQDADVSSGPSLSGGEQTVTHVVTVQYGSATQMVALLRPLMAPTSQLSVYAPANTLILTDYASNIQNLLRIVGILDREGAAEITIVALKHASATDIADVITRLYPNVTQAMPGMPQMPQVNVGESERVLIFPDPRTNSMLIRTENQANLKQVRDLIDRLDVPAKVGGNTRVVYLRNADAVKMAEILRGLMSGERSAQAAAPTVPGRPAAAKGAEASLIQADEATNSLIISASDAVFNNLRAVIEKLDVRRAQVYIEALIAEVSTDKASEFGFQWAGGADARGGTLGGMTNFPGSGAGIAAAAVDPRTLAGAGGLSLAYVGKSITLSNGTTVKSLGALARALEEQSIANILSTPNLLTLDNAEAKIIVGQNVPFLTGSFSQTGTTTTGAVNPFQTIERQDVGLTLKIKPQISEGGSIKLKILQEVSSVASAVGVGASDLITNKRSIDTTVIVDDGNTVVLGGLVEDRVSESTQAVPFLGRIPLLGWLFKYRTQKKNKTNLMVFLRPVIVRSPQDSYNFTASRYEYMR
ncbi:MAG: type II secretion system secretin GspD, partial [Phaeospirillum sp.]|nr:type II secretion system secretin GspD [Phaeospirillum sp.]